MMLFWAITFSLSWTCLCAPLSPPPLAACPCSCLSQASLPLPPPSCLWPWGLLSLFLPWVLAFSPSHLPRPPLQVLSVLSSCFPWRPRGAAWSTLSTVARISPVLSCVRRWGRPSPIQVSCSILLGWSWSSWLQVGQRVLWGDHFWIESRGLRVS